MSTSSLGSVASIAQFAAAILSKKGSGTSTPSSGSGAAAGSGQAASTDTVQAGLVAAPRDFKTTLAQRALDRQQAAIGHELAQDLAKTGASLAGAVSFSLGSDGQVALEGADADKAHVESALAKDTSNPSMRTRLGSVLRSAQALSSTAQQSNAISMAARYGGNAGNVMAMYGQFMGHQSTAPAVMTLSGTTTSLHYPGSLASQA